MKEFAILAMMVVLGLIYIHQPIEIKNNSNYTSNTYASLGNQIKFERLKQQITTKELSQKLNINEGTLVNIENDNVMPTKFLLVDIQNILKKEIIMDTYNIE
jgi:DNA-binding XRE family transcriptional regulator